MTEITSVPPPPPVQVGELVAGKYLVQHAVAEGGMGIVYAAKHLELDQEVALKVMRTELRGRISTKRFTLEARATAKLKSPHVARVFDVGVLDSGTPFMIMELLEGKDLESLVQEEGALDPIAAADLMVQACEAIAEAHEAGIIHRDLKPANLFVTRTQQGAPFVKVLDFGISKATIDGASAGGTAAGTVMGSPPYMSPEQLRSSNAADARSDIWSLGVILYELVTGALPFDGEGLGDIALKVHHDQPKWPRELVPSVQEDYEAIVKKCLTKERDKRYGHVSELQADLLTFVSTHAPATGPISIRSSQPRLVFPRERVSTPKSIDLAETVVREHAPVTTSTKPAPSRNAVRAIAAGAVALLLAGIAFAIGSTFTSRPVAASPPETARPAAPPPPLATVEAKPAEPSSAPLASAASAAPVASVIDPPKPKPQATFVAVKAPRPAVSTSPPTSPQAPPPTPEPAPAPTGKAIRDRGF